MGPNNLRCNTVDPTGNTQQCFAQVNIVDTVAPSLEMAVSPSVLWAPNHQLQEVAITTSTSDLCDPWAYVQCTASSNEAPLGLGSGNTPVDIEWRDNNDAGATPRLYLRAERSGTGTGRVYTIECTSYDQSGNTTTKTATVTVPHDIGNGL